MFPSSFYIIPPAASLKRTAIPTGILGNPLDLVQSDRPWLTVENVPSGAPQKKVLIFADHFFSYRKNSMQQQINRKLQKASDEGFTIYVLSQNGILQSWNNQPIPNNYSLPFPDYSSNKIRQIAQQAHQLRADQIFILDHVGANALLNMANCINMDDFISIPNQCIKYINENANIDQLNFFSLESTTVFSSYLTQDSFTKKLTLNHIETDFDKLVDVVSIIPFFQKLNLTSCKDIPSFFQCLDNSSLSQLEEINLSHTDVMAANIWGLFNAAPYLKEVNLFGCPSAEDALKGLQPDSLPHLKKIYLNLLDIGMTADKTLRNAAVHADILLSEPESNLADDDSDDIAETSDISTNSHQPAPPADIAKLNDNFFEMKNTITSQSYTEYFPGVPPEDYRLRLWSPDLDAELKTLTVQQKITAPDFKSFEISSQNNVPNDWKRHAGVKPLSTQDGTEIILPSLDAQEMLLQLDIKTADGKSPHYTIQHSKQAGFYKIILSEPLNGTIRFQVAAPKKERPDHLKKLSERYQKFSEKDLPPPSFNTLREAAHYIQQNKTGRCDLRALAAYEELTRTLNPANVRIVRNDIHTYLEVFEQNTWWKVDLGGYPTQNLQKKPLPEWHASSASTDPMIPLPPAAGMEYRSWNEIKNTSDTTLVAIESDAALKELLAQLNPLYKNIFIAKKPEDLTLSGSSMTSQGEIKSEYTAFKRWLDAHPAGLICVDAREFTADQIAQLNDLLDRKIEKRTLSDKYRILLIDHPAREYGPDFKRRIPCKTSFEKHSAPLLAPFAGNAIDSQTVEIDLFNSPYWKRLLLGQWQLQPTAQGDFSFTWQKGRLLQAIEQKDIAAIAFKNPPLTDQTFIDFIVELQSLKRIPWADQITPVSPHITFHQTNGYDWFALANNVSLAALTANDEPLVLSDANILTFIEDPQVTFSPDNNQLSLAKSHLTRCQEEKKALNVVVSYSTTESALAQLLTAAQTKNVPVRLLTLSQHPFFMQIRFAEEKEASLSPFSTPCQWQIATDLEFTARQLLQQPNTTVFDLSTLSPAELSRFPLTINETREHFLQTGHFALTAPLSDVLKKLEQGETIILYGTRIPPALYEALTTLTLGKIEGKPFAGKLHIIVPSTEQKAAESIAGKTLQFAASPTHDEKRQLLALDSKADHSLADTKELSFAQLEQRYLQVQLDKQRTPFSRHPAETDEKHDEKYANQLDQNRFAQVIQALKLAPWAMIEGPTGIGKSFFLQQYFPQECKEPVTTTLKDWLNKPSILILDEASFKSELSGMNENFLERFKTLRANPPGFLYQGKYYPLTPQHKVIFAFNPASYGAGRSTTGFLSEQALNVSFAALPDFYLRARLIMPLLQKRFAHTTLDLKKIAAPLLEVYRWICKNGPQNEVLMTPREIRAIINLLAGHINAQVDTNTAVQMATEIARRIGRQTLMHHADARAAFDKTFSPTSQVLERTLALPSLEPYQQSAYRQIQLFLQARKALTADNHDLGLGGVIIEGESGSGKTHLTHLIASEFKQSDVFHISPSTPFHEKERILREAFEKGALVIAEEFNTSLWPNKLLNNFLMGQNPDGSPATKPGFFLLATQNPPSYHGRENIDPAISHRLYKITANWPSYPQKTMEKDKALIAALEQYIAAQIKPNLLSLFGNKDTPDRIQAAEKLCDAIRSKIAVEAKDREKLIEILSTGTLGELIKQHLTACRSTLTLPDFLQQKLAASADASASQQVLTRKY